MTPKINFFFRKLSKLNKNGYFHLVQTQKWHNQIVAVSQWQKPL